MEIFESGQKVEHLSFEFKSNQHFQPFFNKLKNIFLTK